MQSNNSRHIVLQDKIINTGSSPIFDENYTEIGNVHYKFFSASGKVELTDVNGRVISKGKAKLLTLLPKWILEGENGEKTGQINRNISLFKKTYTYKNKNGETYKIKGNIWDRKFKIYKNDRLAIDVSTISKVISLRPYTFLIEILDESIDTWEAINIVQGVRVLVKREKESNKHHHPA
jgi:uncharacterized protein YxjI